ALPIFCSVYSVVAGADAAAIDELAGFPGAEEERGEARLPVGGAPAADDELLALYTLDFQPGFGALVAVGAVDQLGDDALLVGVAHGPEHILAMPMNMF